MVAPQYWGWAPWRAAACTISWPTTAASATQKPMTSLTIHDPMAAANAPLAASAAITAAPALLPSVRMTLEAPGLPLPCS